MESRRGFTPSTVGFSLLPSELIQSIVFQLALPDFFGLKFVNKFISTIISDQDFVRNYNRRSSSATWLFIYKKRWHRDAVLDGFTDYCNRWFSILIADMLKHVVPPGEDLYFLTGSGNIFLFALNMSREVISVNPSNKTVKKIPPSPLGPRGTSSWRRSGMKLLSGPSESGHFKFLFAEMFENSPLLFEYNSETNKWRSMEPKEVGTNFKFPMEEKGYTYLSASNRSRVSIIIAVGSHDHDEMPIVVRPIFEEADNLTVGFSWGNVIDRLHVYGDGRMLIVRSANHDDVEEGEDERTKRGGRGRVIKGIELWGLSPNGGRQWELMSKVPNGLIDEVKKPYGAMMGCLQEREGTIRAVLMSNFEGAWHIIWLCYDMEKRFWKWIPLPQCIMKGSNMAGITFSSGLTLSS